MEEAADSKETKRRRLLPCSSVTNDDDSLMETSDNMHEENERVEKSARVQDCDNNIDPRVDADIQKVVSLIEKRKSVPPNYYNDLSPYDGNVSIRFDGVRPDAEYIHLMMMIPPALRMFVRIYDGVYPDGLNGTFGFVIFNCHEIAKNFLQSFNGKKFYNPDITYKLSWAPFQYGKCENVDVYEEKTICESDTEAETKLDINSNSDSEADSDSDSKADSDCDSKADSNTELNTDSSTSGSDSESVQETEDRQLLSRKETVEESQARKAKLMLEKKQYEDFYIRLDKEFHESGDSWPWPASRKPLEVCQRHRGGCASSILYLDFVDPLVEKEDMERIFKKYGPCSVNLPHGKGFGYVEFVERKSALQAYKKLYFAMRRLRICYLDWGIRAKAVTDSEEDKPTGSPKDDVSLNSTFDYHSIQRENMRRQKHWFLHCPLLGSKCRYPQNTLILPSVGDG